MNYRGIKKLGLELGVEVSNDLEWDHVDLQWEVWYDAPLGKSFAGSHIHIDRYMDEGQEINGEWKPKLNKYEVWDMVATAMKGYSFDLGDCEQGCSCGWDTTD